MRVKKAETSSFGYLDGKGLVSTDVRAEKVSRSVYRCSQFPWYGFMYRPAASFERSGPPCRDIPEKLLCFGRISQLYSV